MPAVDRVADDLPRRVLVVLWILGLLGGCLYVLRPFITPLICATVIAISTWPLLLRLQGRLGGSRGAAIAVVLGVIAVAFLVPIYFGAMAIAQSIGNLMSWTRDLDSKALPPVPDWLANLPVLGARIAAERETLMREGSDGLRAQVSANASVMLQWLLSRVGGLIGMFVQVAITLGFTAVIYARGDQVRVQVLGFARRLAGDRGEEAARLAGLATRGVALGVVLTPLIQAILAGVGMAIAGAPNVGLFALFVLLTCLAQVGPIPAMAIPVALLFARGDTMPASLLAAWALVVHASGPIVRPLLIKRGVDLSMPLILCGVIGGVAAFGVVGLFLGPVLLAVSLALLGSWIQGETPGEARKAS